MIKLALTHRLFCLLLSTCFLLSRSNRYNFLCISLYAFFNKHIFYLFTHILIKDYGLLTSNITKSYLYWGLKAYLKSFSRAKNTLISTKNKNLILYSTPLQLVNYSFKKKTFNKIIMYFIFNFNKINTCFTNSFLLTFSYIFLSKEVGFFYFYNLFYFKIYNY